MHFYQVLCFLADSKALNCQYLLPRAHSAHYQLSGSAALIIIWPHLFGWIGAVIFICKNVTKWEKVFISQLWVWFIWQRLLCDHKDPLNAVASQTALQTKAIFSKNHYQLPLKAAFKWPLRFHYSLIIKNTYTVTQRRHAKRSLWQGGAAWWLL